MKEGLKCFFILIIICVVRCACFGQSWSSEGVDNFNAYKRYYRSMSDFSKLSADDIIYLPNPNGEILAFRLENNTTLSQGLQSKYPQIRSFSGVSLDVSRLYLRLTIYEEKINAYIFDEENTFLVQPIDNHIYEVFWKKDAHRTLKSFCSLVPKENGSSDVLMSTVATRDVYKKYRLALSCTYEYAVAVSNTTTPTVPQVLAAMATTINRVNGIYERELGITLELIPNNDTLIFTTNSSAYFTNNNAYALIDENSQLVNARIGINNYDIGHVFSTQGGGLASLASICTNAKAEGVTGIGNPYNDPFDVDYVSHEIGHQLGANHSMNKCDDDNEERFTAYEPGSGSTIMGYAGICDANNLQSNSHDYFHLISKKEIYNHLSSNSIAQCGVTLANNIAINDFSVYNEYIIPANTPFELEVPLPLQAEKYNWYQWNLGNFRANENRGATFVNGPNLRSYRATNERKRVFPRIDSVLVGNHNFIGERLSSVSRNLYFKLELQNMNGNWGSNKSSSDSLVIKVQSNGEGFLITNLNNSGVRWKKNIPAKINWNIANTNVQPIMCNEVDIFLSKDGGWNFEDTIALNVPNSGTFTYIPSDTLPSSNTYRVKVKCSNNIFFDINNVNITIDTLPPTDISSLFLENVRVYPNPVDDKLFIKLEKAGNYTVKVYDILGRVVDERVIMQLEQVIDLSALDAGNYVLWIEHTTSKQKFSKLFTKQ